MTFTRAFAVVCLALVATPVLAGDPPASQGSPAAPEPPRRIQVGFEERIRNENFDNIVDHSDAASDTRRQWRFRTRLWAAVPFGNRAEVHVGLANESRLVTVPATPLRRDETVFEALYLDLKLGRTTTARIGRQDIVRGEGFILSDGSPLDGSRSMYVNGVDVTHAFTPASRVELIALSNPARDVYLPIVSDANKPLIEWNERIAGAYYTRDLSPQKKDTAGNLQAYYLYKSASHDGRNATNPQYIPDRGFSTLGARYAQALGPSWSATAEFAGQWGRQDPDTAIRAWGGYARLRRAFVHPWSPSVSFGCTLLSGDDPSTPTVERWDPVVSRWPKWGEALIFALGPETGQAYATNMVMWQAEATLSPGSRITSIRGTYYHLSAFHPFAGSPAVFGRGTTRGDLVVTRMDLAVNRLAKAHVLYERLLPGNFYAGRAPGYYFRVELSVALSKAFLLGK